jgi:adenylate cyclase
MSMVGTAMGANDLNDITGWLAEGARSAPSPPKLMGELCERLVASGLPLWRVGVFVRTLHPNVFGRSFVWRPGAEVVVGKADFDVTQSQEYLTSPLAELFASAVEVRRRLTDIVTDATSPFLRDMRDDAVTDYIAMPVVFTDDSVHAVSWSTRQPGGFTDDQVAALRSVVVPLARLIEIMVLYRTAIMLLETYVGSRAGERILAGQIRRGHTETMQAAIWLSDLRGFTPLSDRLPPETVVDVLNRYFDCQVGPILRHGGEVLKFMGDGLLAVFPIADGGDTAQICSRVLDAAHESRALVEALRYAVGDHAIESFRFGLALHVGRVLYGNIGGGDRLDFTCIGPAVNLAARLEKIAGRLNRTVVASGEFAHAFQDGWTDLGEFPIAGFSKVERVYGLQDETPYSSGSVVNSSG